MAETLNKSYACFAGPCQEQDVPMIKELLTYDAVALDACDLIRTSQGILTYRTLPSSLHWSRQTEWPWAIKEAQLCKHHRVLEAGGAGCMMKYPVAKRCRSVVVADISEGDMHHTDKAIDLLGFDNITQVIGDVRNLPFPKDWFDRVFCISVLEHVQDGHSKALDELDRVLKPGGILLLSMDVVIIGAPGSGNNFYLSIEDVQRLLPVLGLEEISVEPNRIYGQLDQEGVTIGVILVKYVKECSDGS